MATRADEAAQVVKSPAQPAVPQPKPAVKAGVYDEGKLLYRGTSMDEWKAIQIGDKFGNLRTAEGLRGETYISNSDRFSGKYKDFATSNNTGVIIEFKPETASKIIGKDPHAIGLKGGEKSFVAKDVRLKDVAKVTDAKGNVIYEARVAQPKPAVSADPLMQEAKKYKSAEEFLSSRQFAFHGTSPEAKTAIENFGFNPNAKFPDSPIYLATNEKITTGYGKGVVAKDITNFNLLDISTTEGKNIVKESGLDPGFFIEPNKKLKDYLKQNSYDGIKMPTSRDNADLIITNIDKLNISKTKSQLTDIWNQSRVAQPAIKAKPFITTDIQGNQVEQSFIRAGTKLEKIGGAARSRGYNTIPDKAGYEKAYKPYGEQGAGYYYSKKAGSK